MAISFVSASMAGLIKVINEYEITWKRNQIAKFGIIAVKNACSFGDCSFLFIALCSEPRFYNVLNIVCTYPNWSYHYCSISDQWISMGKTISIFTSILIACFAVLIAFISLWAADPRDGLQMVSRYLFHLSFNHFYSSVIPNAMCRLVYKRWTLLTLEMMVMKW